MNEYILRDGEIAFNDPETGLVTIMNVNTAIELRRKMSGEDQKMQEFKEDYIKKLEGVLNQLDDLKAKMVEKEKELASVKAKQFFDNLYLDGKDPLQHVIYQNCGSCNQYCKVKEYYALFDAMLDDRKTHFYVTDDGDIFTSAADVERYFYLPKGSVYAYFKGLQKTLSSMKVRGHVGLCKIEKTRLFPNSWVPKTDMSMYTPEDVETKEKQLTIYKQAVQAAVDSYKAMEAE